MVPGTYYIRIDGLESAYTHKQQFAVFLLSLHTLSSSTAVSLVNSLGTRPDGAQVHLLSFNS